jgi:hypothetical protein
MRWLCISWFYILFGFGNSFGLSLLTLHAEEPIARKVVASQVAESVRTILTAQCAECHSGGTTEGSLDIESQMVQGLNHDSVDRWVLIYDRMVSGEMPPGKPCDTETIAAIQKDLLPELIRVDRERINILGRTTFRRMNRLEFENRLRSLLKAPWLQVKNILPEESIAYRFNKVGEALDVSHVNIARYMQAVDYALREVIATTIEPVSTGTKRYYAREQPSFNRKVQYNEFNRSAERATFPLIGYEADVEMLKDPKRQVTVGESNPELREREAIGVVASSYEPLEPVFGEFKAPVSGKYKLRVKGYTFWVAGEEKRWWKPDREKTSIGRRAEPVAIYAQSPPRQLRKLGEFDFQIEPSVQELEVYLLRGETIRPDPVRLFRSRPPNFRNPLAEKEGMPGVAYNYLEVEGPQIEQWPSYGHQLLFGDLPLAKLEKGKTEVTSLQPHDDAARLLDRFLKEAYLRPVDNAQKEALLEVFDQALRSEFSFQDAMIAMYTAALCSPSFVCFEEPVGDLDAIAVANRLSLFLWNQPAEEDMRTWAQTPDVKNSDEIRRQTERMLADPRVRLFVDAFLDYWLDLRKLNDTSPDEVLYPDYYLDDALVDAAQAETQLYLLDLIQQNKSVRYLVDSEDTFVNERLAAHYGLTDVSGVAMRRVSLPDNSTRGGILTQASVLKVTANGTTTSPVVRGAWIGERILGTRIPPPPKSVPAIEPDTRGATTIREQLELHRADPSCAGCHTKIDPVGFALESFDVVGGWRTQYRSLGEKGDAVEGIGKNGQPFTFKMGPQVDPMGELPTSEKFRDVEELKRILVGHDRAIARNLLVQWTIYATGSPPRISDRSEIERILDRLQSDGYPLGSMVQELVCSPIFLRK